MVDANIANARMSHSFIKAGPYFASPDHDRIGDVINPHGSGEVFHVVFICGQIETLIAFIELGEVTNEISQHPLRPFQSKSTPPSYTANINIYDALLSVFCTGSC